MNRSGLAKYSFLAGTFLLAASMPLSMFGMSLAQFLLLGGWLLGGSPLQHFRKALVRPVPGLLMGLFLLHLAGVFYSADFDYAFNDLRIKLPLLLMPVMFYTSPVDLRPFARPVLGVLVAAVLASTFISFGVLHDWLPHEKPVRDIRDISVFISHIRLSLLICFCIFLLAHTAQRKGRKTERLLCLAAMAWLGYFLYVLESMTGVLVLFIAAAFLLLRFVSRNKKMRLPILASLVIIPALLVVFVRHEASRIHSDAPVDFESLPALTANGNPYQHHRERTEQENGFLVWTHVCEAELIENWNNRSAFDYHGTDLAGHEIRFTLIRYLASKGLTKDSAGLAALGPGDIESIEKGIANADHTRMGDLRLRIRKSIKEYYLFRAGSNPTGSSLMQRMEYWNAGLQIFSRNWLTGVGTGDVQIAFDDQYRRSGTRLAPEKWHRAHNQYLTFAITFGAPGLLFFLLVLLYPLRAARPYPYLAFWLIACLSMLTEDTLETQAGVTFFAFLNCFLLFQYPADSPRSPDR